jgi:serine protease Do
MIKSFLNLKNICLLTLTLIFSGCISNVIPPTHNKQSSNSTSPLPSPNYQENTDNSGKKIIKVSSKSEEDKSLVLIIQGSEMRGTGVIIGRDDKFLHILTARHVIGSSPGIEDPIEVHYNNNKVESIDSSNYDSIVKLSPDKSPDDKSSEDLALLLIKYDSNQQYYYVKLGNLDKERGDLKNSAPVNVVGYLPCSGSSSKKVQRSKGMIEDIQDVGITNLNTLNNASPYQYDLNYTNNTITGMSGSPIFNERQELVGIHASGSEIDPKQKQYDLEKCPSLPSDPDPKYTNNLGTSIEKIKIFIKLVLPKNLDNSNSQKTLPETSKTADSENSKIQESKCPLFVLDKRPGC